MNFRAASFTFLLSLPLFARQKTDVIVMKNGDRLTCEIKKLDHGVLSASLDYIDGTVSVDWAKVVRLESDQLFAVETESGMTYTGTLRTVGGPGDQPRKIEIADSQRQRQAVVEQPQVTVADQYGTSEWNRMHGSFSTGLIYNKANSSTQHNLSSQLAYRRERTTAQISYSGALSNATGSPTATRSQVELQGIRLLRWENWFYAGDASFLQSSSQGINSQTTLGGGIGRYLRNTSSTRISLLGGLAELTTHYADRPTQHNLVSLIAAEVNVFRFKKLDLTVTPVLVPSLDEGGRIRFKLNAQYQVEVVSNLWWNVTFYGNWDNRPPAGFVGSDYGTSLGISYKFH